MAAKTTYLRSSMSMVSIVKSRFHWARHGSLVLSTCACQPMLTYPLPGATYLAILRVHTRQVDLGCEGYLRGDVGVAWPAVDLDAVDAVLVDTLHVQSVNMCPECYTLVLTCGGPRIVPFQSDMRRSSPLSRPYEHASIESLALKPRHDH
jgi:hypothetical protein